MGRCSILEARSTTWGRQLSVKLSIIIPAFNEAAYIGATLDSLEAAAAHLRDNADVEAEVIVVDNNSADDTAAIARSKGARVVVESLGLDQPALYRAVPPPEGDVGRVVRAARAVGGRSRWPVAVGAGPLISIFSRGRPLRNPRRRHGSSL